MLPLVRADQASERAGTQSRHRPEVANKDLRLHARRNSGEGGLAGAFTVLYGRGYLASYRPEVCRSRARLGVTVLFASPKVENWDEARRIVDERGFRRLYMRPWSVDELQAAFFYENPQSPRFVREFWVRYYIAGPVARWYFIPLEEAFAKLSDALLHVVKLGAIDATLFRGGMDNGQHSHKIFCAWPSEDCTEVAQFTFISEWTELSFAIACYRGSVANWMQSIEDLADDPQLRSAAGTLFERYAHYRLSRGGTFPSIDDPNVKLVLTRRSVQFFNGNSLSVEDGRASHSFYLRPNSSSSSFPVIDSVYLPNVMFQVSIARKRKPMRKSTFDRLCAELSEYGRAHPEAASGIEDGSSMRPWIVLVKMRGDNSQQSEGLTLVEEVADGEPAASEAPQTPRKRRRCVSSVKQATRDPAARRPVQKKTLVKFQATVVLGEDETAPVDYKVKLQEVYDTVRSRMVGDVDPGHAQLKDYTSHDLGANDFVYLVMRRGCSRKQYEELDDDVCVFGVWMEALRSQLEDGTYSTVVSMECTAGTFLDEYRELSVFIDERVGVELRYDDPVVLHVAPGLDAAPGSNVTTEFLTETSVKVTILSTRRECQYFRLCLHTHADMD